MSDATTTDLYEVTMAMSYLREAMTGPATFSLFVRDLPSDRGFLVAAGLESALDFLSGFRIGAEDVDAFASALHRPPADVDALLGLEFTGQVRAVPEGRIVLAGEPLLEVTAPLPQAQLVETYVLNQVTSATASDTTSSKRPCPGRPVTAGIPGELHPDRTGPYEGEEKMMLHTVEWKVRLYLSEDDEGTTKARVVVNTGTTTLTGHGAARCNPADAEVPEIGDELAAGRAMHDLGQQLVSTAERDIKDLGAPATGRSPRPAAGWPV